VGILYLLFFVYIKERKILIVISFIIFGLGIVSAIGLFVDLINISSIDSFLIDNSNFSLIAKVGTIALMLFLSILVIIFSILLDGIIWLIYFTIYKFLKRKDVRSEKK